MKMKLSGYVAVYREDMAMVMALVSFNSIILFNFFSFSNTFMEIYSEFVNWEIL